MKDFDTMEKELREKRGPQEEKISMKMLDKIFNATEASDEFEEWCKKNESTKKLLSKEEVLCAMGDLASEIINFTSGAKPRSTITFLAAIKVDSIVNKLFQDEGEE